MSDPRIYKILPSAIWAGVRSAASWAGSAVDLRDGYIHFSTAAQLPGTLAAHYAGQRDLVVVAFDAAAFGDALKWEASRGGALFPHLYAPLAPAAALAEWPVDVAPDGRCALPADLAA